MMKSKSAAVNRAGGRIMRDGCVYWQAASQIDNLSVAIVVAEICTNMMLGKSEFGGFVV